MRTFGVEEELLIVEPGSGAPLPLVDQVLAIMGRPGDVEREFKLEQVETQTQPCLTHEELLGQLYHGRRALDRAARQVDARIAALGTSPLSAATHLSPGERYAAMAEEFRITSQEQLTCGLHVHVGVESPAEGVLVLDRIREWLPVLVAVSANSPFWRGVNTGYASFRTQAWNRWPTSGPQQVFGSLDAYRRLVDAMVRSGAISDEGMVYFDARLSHRHPTVEVRASDVCLDAADSALVAVLVRGLVETAAREAALGVPPLGTPVAVLRLASWRASRSGLNGSLVHPVEGVPVSAADALAALLSHVGTVLRESGELPAAEHAVRDLLARGSGERMQREAASDGEGLADVVSAAVAATQQRNGGWDGGA
ncbi:putative glutamate--cysteine ligase 2 [Sinomonas cyclohexanicum]|uniref:Putative glutamate--cysteine ligase 2 n=1 Tax=Sinomonas cyclohexanicum TaxID=322009 RepID=A0ABM7PZ87_SINCY|nr:glutamate--cysteine ligase [Corynebacterium cyclohexanicum]BCT77620.1 putative glutamate--cysteine ligase 2 [Corynebacterium cyclohexanicum]